MDFNKIVNKRLSSSLASFSFDCGKTDLNEFFRDDALLHDQEHLTRTYLVFNEDNPDELLAYFSLANDKISSLLTRTNNQFRRVRNNVHSTLHRYREFPAIKLARLAVAEEYQGQGLGTYILYIVLQEYLYPDAKSGCRFITVDSDMEAVGFYEKLGFEELQLQKHEYTDSTTKNMFMDLVDLESLFTETSES